MKALIIYGPTATGKTSLALKIAAKFGADLISADSRQVYKGLDIGTGKLSEDLLKSKVDRFPEGWIVSGIKIYGFDIVRPGSVFTAADFSLFASNALTKINQSHRLPIVVGGSGFYIKVLLDGIESFGVGANWQLRSKLEKLPTETLYKKLFAASPLRAKLMNNSDRKNPRRLIRAIEISTSRQKQKLIESSSQIGAKIDSYCLLALTAPNEYLFERADGWIDNRLDNGLIEEVNKLIRNGVSKNWLDNLGLEYRWIKRYINKEVTFEVAKNSLKGDIHNLIRRQKTFFNKFKEKRLFDITKKNFYKEVESYTKEKLRI